MDYGSQGEVIFEDRTEARVAAELLRKAGRLDLIEYIRPPLKNARIGYLEFTAKMREQQNGVVNEGIHRIIEPEIGVEVIAALEKVSNLNFRQGAENAFRRKDYMGAKLLELLELRKRVEQTWPIVKIGGLAIRGLDHDKEQILSERYTFVERYFAKRGWDINDPTPEQIIEVRSQPEWSGKSLQEQET